VRAIFGWIGILGGAIPMLAQSVPDSTVEDTIVVTASLEEEAADELPATVDVIDQQEITARQVTTVADLLGTLPAMTVVRSGSPGQVTSLFSRGTESDHTLVLWNGIELNDPYFGGFNWAFLPTDGIGRVEVARGPFSSLYGSDALGGVVQVISGRHSGARLDLEAGGNGYRRGGLSAGARLGEVQLEVAGHLRQGDGEIQNDFYDGQELMAHADWSLRPGMSVGVVARAAETETGIPYSGGQPSPRRQIAWNERLVGVPLRFESNRWRLHAQLSGVRYESAFRDPDDPFGFTASDTDSRALRARAVATYAWRKSSWLAFGSEAEESSVDDRSVFGNNLENEGQGTWSVFGEVHHTLGRLGIDFGLRRDENDVFGGQTSPRLGLQWTLANRTRWWAAYGQGFRAPSVGELFFPATGNRDLQPETSASYEIGLDHRRGSWQLSLLGFNNELSNLIDFDFATFRNVNVGRARTRGIEAGIGLASSRWALRWNGTYLDAEDLATGLPLLRRPEESSNLVVTYAPDSWSITATGRYVGGRDDVDPVTFERAVNDSYTRLDLAGRWQATRRVAPYLRLDNATDEDYQEALGFPAPGITLIAGVSLTTP
jgi:outer membrane cobalamin receptor